MSESISYIMGQEDRASDPCGLPSGDLFGLSQNVGMGWKPEKLRGKQVLILSTQGGMRADDGTPIALGYHTDHWEVGLLMKEAALEISELGGVPFAGYISDPCDGRSQGTNGMFDYLLYRNDSAMVYRRLIRSLPTRSGVIGIATCEKGLPATMIALAAMHDLPCIIVPGGVTLPQRKGRMRGRSKPLAHDLPNGIFRCRKQRIWDAGYVQRLVAGANFWGQPQQLRSWQRRSACPCPTPR
jgi:dihydroxyacid dehydratase/phosphogluconate dehydratase